MTSFEDFEKQVRTFGSAGAGADPWARTPEGAAVVAQERALDDWLDKLVTPAMPVSVDAICAAVLAKSRHLTPAFVRLSTAASILLAIGGFMLGRYQMARDLIDSQYYFTTMFDIGY
ncbi:MAG TPA: hypothetical protein DCX19_03170 [Alphaproteobacteria bacterium]|nr:hypothetical protein [Alphaproteobacteria bacterium]